MPRLKSAINLKVSRETEAPAVAEAPPETPPKAPLEPPAPPKPPVPPCGLDGASVNSKIVVVSDTGKKTPVLMTPGGEVPLAADDVAWSLAPGARINKVSENKFVGVQLDHNRAVAPLEATTARDVIHRFHKHFHG